MVVRLSFQISVSSRNYFRHLEQLKRATTLFETSFRSQLFSMPHFRVQNFFPDEQALRHQILTTSMRQSWSHHLRNALPDKLKRVDAGVDTELHSKGYKRGIYTISSHGVSHKAWDALLNRIRHDSRLEYSPLFRTSGPDRTSESVVFPTGSSLAEHLGLGEDYSSSVLCRLVTY